MKLSFVDISSYGIAMLFALLVHAVVIGLMSFNWNDPTVSHMDIQPYYIEASVVSENPYTAAQERQRDRQLQRIENKLRDRRVTEARLKSEQEAWEKARANRPEPKRVLPEPIVEPESDIEQKTETKPSEAEASAAFAEELALAMKQEANARKAVTDDEKAMVYVAQIQREIIQNWSRPPSARNGMKALLRVRLIPTGEVIDVKVEDSSGNDAFDRSAVLAVRKANRFIVPSDSRRFERDFREFTVLFRPDDLRL
ncbi:MAG: cell envelope integrity protein TolA [Pseudomonadales bacterium]|nr:cell envelope integrity protein TolA [Pseudomonadales bacterium]MBO6563573.1 cell envelope integrity protein TolA [Pseudomonadales bacterium]MBO6594362.1 cell envelope integrity protein TolA [Pseudomonadales bacterium]MBO6655538.1 cell envelope integrity protein TolA [Pseudomonadales bacterium]MBO6700863.1 cell envelope integrity protein TolA [Pseudomonadales bacterium]